ncbi:MAG: hypothetical protein ACJ8MH_18565 [Povalibacter sp.]|jgi:hypothetical protein
MKNSPARIQAEKTKLFPIVALLVKGMSIGQVAPRLHHPIA